MKITHNDFCTDDSLSVDDKPLQSKDPKFLQFLCHRLISKTKDLPMLYRTLTELVDGVGEYKDLGQCEQCGDWNAQYTVEI